MREKRKELFDFHIKNPANCTNDCVKSLRDSVEEQDKQAIQRLKEEVPDMVIHTKDKEIDFHEIITKIFGEFK